MITKKTVAAAVLAGSVLAMTAAPVVAYASESSVVQPAETLAEQVQRIHVTGMQARIDAGTARDAILSATGRDQSHTAYTTATQLRATAKQIDAEAQALFTADDPALQENHAALGVSLAQGMSGAQDAVKTLDQTVADRVKRIHDNGIQANYDAVAIKGEADKAVIPALARAVLNAATQLRATAKGIDDEGQGMFDVFYPTLGDNSSEMGVSAAQGMSGAQHAVKTADEAIAIAQSKLSSFAVQH